MSDILGVLNPGYFLQKIGNSSPKSYLSLLRDLVTLFHISPFQNILDRIFFHHIQSPGSRDFTGGAGPRFVELFLYLPRYRLLLLLEIYLHIYRFSDIRE